MISDFLKISKSQKQNGRAKTFSKNERVNLFFYPEGPEVHETRCFDFKFQVIMDLQDRKTNWSIHFWEKFWVTILIWGFTDLYVLGFFKCFYLKSINNKNYVLQKLCLSYLYFVQQNGVIWCHHCHHVIKWLDLLIMYTN